MKARILSILLAVLTVTSCTKTITRVDLQEHNKGALIWKMALDSMTIEQEHTTYRSKDFPDLQDDGIVFFADGTGVRFQGKKHFFGAPQVDEFKFEWHQDLTQTNKFYMYAPGTRDTGPRNTISVSTDLTGSLITIQVTGDKEFYNYYFHIISQ